MANTKIFFIQYIPYRGKCYVNSAFHNCTKFVILSRLVVQIWHFLSKIIRESLNKHNLEMHNFSLNMAYPKNQAFGTKLVLIL